MMIRTDKIEVRMSKEEKAGIKAAAKAMGVDMSTYCRMATLEKMRKKVK